MRIVGGIYTEVVREPFSREVMGSALRAAIALSASGLPNKVLSLCSSEELPIVQAICGGLETEIEIKPRSRSIVFEYPTAISPPRVSTAHTPLGDLHDEGSSGQVTLVFGMLETRVDVDSEVVVVDPQRPALSALEDFVTWRHANRVAIVGNRSEIHGLAGEAADDEEAVRAVARRYEADVVIMKDGLRGALAIEGDAVSRVPAFRSHILKPVGSGDVFSACFAHLWGERKLPVGPALEGASKATAAWMDIGPVGVVRPEGSVRADRQPVTPSDGVYLAGPFFNASQRWLVDTVADAIRASGIRLFSPLHDVGRGEPGGVGKEDLDGLNSCETVLALLDGFDAGTLIEVGYARRAGKRVVAYLDEEANPKDLTMLLATEVDLVRDLPTAVMEACTKPSILGTDA